MIICDKCGKENDDNRYICWDCGRELVNRKQEDQSYKSNNEFKPEETNDNSNHNVCPKCGHTIVTGAIFCNKCGLNLHENFNSNSIFCTSCGEENNSALDHCKKCGKRISTSENNKVETNNTNKNNTGKIVLICVIVVISIFLLLGLTAVSYSFISFPKCREKEYHREFRVPSNKAIIEELF